VELEYEITRDDFWAFQRRAIVRRGWWPLWLVLGLAVAILVAAAVGAGLSAMRRTGDVVVAIGNGVVFLVPPALVAVGLYWLLRWSTKRAPAEGGAALGPKRLSITADRIREESGRGLVVEARTGAVEVVETRHHVFLFIDRVSAFVVPRRAFTGPDGVERLRALVRTHERAPSVP
jgi:hypothetical protein